MDDDASPGVVLQEATKKVRSRTPAGKCEHSSHYRGLGGGALTVLHPVLSCTFVIRHMGHIECSLFIKLRRTECGGAESTFASRQEADESTKEVWIVFIFHSVVVMEPIPL